MTQGKVYTFRTIAPITLGDTFTSLRLIQTTLGLALSDNEKVKLQLLSTKVSNETNTYGVNIEEENVLVFTDVNNTKIYLLERWIEPTSISTIDRVKLTITMTDLDITDPDVIIELLNKNGYKVNNKIVTSL